MTRKASSNKAKYPSESSKELPYVVIQVFAVHVLSLETAMPVSHLREVNFHHQRANPGMERTNAPFRIKCTKTLALAVCVNTVRPR